MSCKLFWQDASCCCFAWGLSLTRVARTCEDPEGLRRGDGHAWCGLLEKLGTSIWPACTLSSPGELDVTEQTRGSGFSV